MTAVDVIEHRPGPALDEPPYSRTCVQCGQAWPCPARKADLLAQAEEMVAERKGEARRVGVLAMVELGVSVWSSTRKDARDEALGGVVVEINDVPDYQTGEVERFFTCLDPYGGGPVKVRRLAESEVTANSVGATTNSRITNLIKRLGKEVGEMTGSYLDPFYADRIRWMGTLASVTNLTN